jgi:lipoprotein NlpI
MIMINKAIILNPKQAYFYNNRGLYQLFLNELEKGLEDINYSLKQNPKNLFAFRNKGIYHYFKGEKDLALRYLTEVFEKDPNMDLVKEYLEKTKNL